MTRSIGGLLDYARLAELNRPADGDALAREVRRLLRDGLKPRDISIALRLDLAHVLELLRRMA
jgi:hypothetical protein